MSYFNGPGSRRPFLTYEMYYPKEDANTRRKKFNDRVEKLEQQVQRLNEQVSSLRQENQNLRNQLEREKWNREVNSRSQSRWVSKY